MLSQVKDKASSLVNGIKTITGQNNKYSADKELARIEDVQKKYTDAVNMQYAAGIQNIENQIQTLPGEYDPARASVNAQYERNIRKNTEQMANLGLTRSGTNLTAQTALETERARGIAAVDAAQLKAMQDLKAQINEYKAQRDSDIAKQSASLYENAYNNISAHERELAQMERQHKYNQQMATLEAAYNFALSTNNFAQQAFLQNEMAALEQAFKIQTLEKQTALDNESYAKRAATDWGYDQQRAKLENQLAMQLYDSKAATDFGYYKQQAALDNKYDIALQQLKNATNAASKTKSASDVLNEFNARYGYGTTGTAIPTSGTLVNMKNDLDYMINNKQISDDTYIYLIRQLGL